MPEPDENGNVIEEAVDHLEVDSDIVQELPVPDNQELTMAVWVAWLVCHWLSAPKVAGLTSAHVGGFSLCRKLTAALSYYYMACKSSLGCLLGLDALGKVKS
ncbi:hypothetical protein TNCV_977521 [Trichonephila clavipes]|nr:hypothetical protein TNCV_977521 [Trichonephila clavipes]